MKRAISVCLCVAALIGAAVALEHRWTPPVTTPAFRDYHFTREEVTEAMLAWLSRRNITTNGTPIIVSSGSHLSAGGQQSLLWIRLEERP